jgi:phenylacetate-CoA ligase
MAAPPPNQLRGIGTHVPVYAYSWAAAGIAVESIDSLQQLPVISKRTLLQAGIEGRLDRRFSAQRLTQESTSGSSGEPMNLYLDGPTRRRRRWRFVRALLGAGYRPGDRLLLISTHRRSRALSLMRWAYEDLRLSEADLAARYLEFKPAVLYGPLRALISIGERLPGGPGKHQPRVLISTAEKLTQHDRQLLLTFFGIDAFDFYGMTEIGLFAWRHPAEPHYRTLADEVFAEFLPSETEPELERLLVTSVRPCAMPLVRYDTGDLVRRDHAAPGAPILEFIGREIDGVLLRNGRRISPYRLTLAMETVLDIERYQIVQQADLSVDVAIQTRAGGAAVLDQARRAVAAVTGPELVVRAMPMPEASPRLGEKFRPVRSFAKATA